MWKRLLWLLPLLFIAVYFLHYAWWGLQADFTHDDLMNMWRSLARPYPDLLKDNLVFWRFSPTYRPFGGFVYKVSLDAAGLNPFPLRVFCYLALVLNILLVYELGRRLTASRGMGALAALLHGYHTNYVGLYLNTGTLYDIFCFTFTLAALLVYLRMRQAEGWRAAGLAAGVCLLYVAALDSKEMALALPLLLLAYELLFHAPDPRRVQAVWHWLRRAAPVPLLTGAMAAACYLGRVSAPEGIQQTGVDYRPVIGVAEYLKQTGHYLGDLIYKRGWFTPGRTAVALLLLFVAAWLLRSRAAAFGAAFFTLGILPMAFLPPRGLSAVYLPLAGLAVSVAVVLVRVTDLLLDPFKRRAGFRPTGWAAEFGLTPSHVVLFLYVALRLLHVHVGMQGFYEAWRRDHLAIRSVIDQMKALHPSVPKNARILMVSDPFGSFNYASQFIACLVYREPSLNFDRLESMEKKPSATEVAAYTLRLGWKEGKLRDFSPAEVPLDP